MCIPNDLCWCHGTGSMLSSYSRYPMLVMPCLCPVLSGTKGSRPTIFTAHRFAQSFCVRPSQPAVFYSMVTHIKIVQLKQSPILDFSCILARYVLCLCPWAHVGSSAKQQTVVCCVFASYVQSLRLPGSDPDNPCMYRAGTCGDCNCVQRNAGKTLIIGSAHATV